MILYNDEDPPPAPDLHFDKPPLLRNSSVNQPPQPTNNAVSILFEADQSTHKMYVPDDDVPQVHWAVSDGYAVRAGRQAMRVNKTVCREKRVEVRRGDGVH